MSPRFGPLTTRSFTQIAALLVALLGAGAAAAEAPEGEWLYSAEGNRLRRIRIDSIDAPPLVSEIVVERASLDPVNGRDVNGQICFFPDGSGRFVMGEDTGQSGGGEGGEDEGIPQGWGIFSADGIQIGKLTATFYAEQPEPFGCAFHPNGTLFTSSVGDPGFGTANGQLIQWFPPFEGFPGEDEDPPIPFPNQEVSKNFCKIATDLGTASSVLVDPTGAVHVAMSGGLQVLRFRPPFPTGPDAAGGCGAQDALGSPMADSVSRSISVLPDTVRFLATFSGLALAPNGNLYVASVFTGKIAEYRLTVGFSQFVREIVTPAAITLPHQFGSPQGLAVDRNGTLYYADLDLVSTGPGIEDFGPGPNGKVWRVTFDEFNDPNTPEIVMQNLAFPDGLGVFRSTPTEWRTLAGGPERRFFNAGESILTPDNVGGLAVRWVAPVGAVLTASPSVAEVEVPGEGPIRVVYYQSWDGNVYAVRFADGRELWRFATEEHPVTFPNTASATIVTLDGRDVVFIGAGQYMYALDAVSGEELWRFGVGTGCRDENGAPPGLCGFERGDERNQIESTALYHHGNVYFGMDVNDVAGGKGGVYAVDAREGTLVWFFDLESGASCAPLPGEAIRRYDPYHSEEQLGLPAGFHARPGCDFPRTPNGCGNVWSSPALDAERDLLFLASSNCDTDDDPATGEPPPPMPPYDEAIFALHAATGEPAWVWRPRAVDNLDLAFGAVPNLFSIDVGGGQMRDVVGVGGKDGTYYVLDREGENAVNGARWDDDPASHLPADLPYWSTQVVPGGALGGIIATAAVDVGSRQVLFSTAPNSVIVPQRPTMHALDMDTGAIVWDNGADTAAESSFGPTSAVPGLAFVGWTPSLASIQAGALRTLRVFQTVDDGFATAAGDVLYAQEMPGIAVGVSSGAAVIDGTVLVGTGVGFRTGNPDAAEDQASNLDGRMVALCVPGTAGCGACNNGADDDGDGAADFGADTGCLSPNDPSEVFGDLDFDGEVTVDDLDLFLKAFGMSAGQPGFFGSADLDGDGAITFVDYQIWLETFRSFNAPPPEPVSPAPACGLLGLEILAVPLAARLRRRRRRGA